MIGMSLKHNFFWLIISKSILMIAGFFTASLINRALGPFGRGIYAEMVTWIGLFSVIFGLSMDSAIYHFANRVLYPVDDKIKFMTTFFLLFIYAFLATIFLNLFIFFFPKQVSIETFKYVWLLDILLIVTMFSANFNIFFQALGKIKFSALVGIIQAFVGIIILSLSYLKGLINLKYVIIYLTIFQLVALFMFLSAFMKLNFFSGKFSKNIAKGIINAGLKQHPATISTFIYTKINQLILFKYCGEFDTGIFSVSLNLIFSLMTIPMTFQTVLYPRVIHSNDDYEITVKAIRVTFYWWGMFIIFSMIFAKPIILLYAGKNFLPSVNILRILLASAWFLPLSSLLAPYYVKSGAFIIASFSAIILGIISIGLNLFLIPIYKTIGAALATSITTLIGFIMTLLFLWYLSKRNPLVVFRPEFKKDFNEIFFIWRKIIR